MNGFAKILARIALWAADHPDVIKAIVDAVAAQHQANQAKPAAASTAAGAVR